MRGTALITVSKGLSEAYNNGRQRVRVLSCCVFTTARCFMSFFFFSSRRRHTRYWRDWSSDVCSSDLSGEREQEDLDEGQTLLEVAGERLGLLAGGADGEPVPDRRGHPVPDHLLRDPV